MNQIQQNVEGLKQRLLPARMADMPRGRTISPQVNSPRMARMSMATYRYVLLSVVIVAVYFLLIASPRYATESQVFVKSSGPQMAAIPAGLSLGVQTEGLKDAYQLKEYIMSADMLELLDAELAVKKHYSGDWDFYSRLPSDASSEAFLAFYREHVLIDVVADSASLKIETQGFTKAFSEAMNKSILANSVTFINNISQQAASEQLIYVEGLIEEKRDQLDKAQQELLAFQNERGVVDTAAVIMAAQTNIIAITAQLTEANTELKAQRSFLSDESAQVRATLNLIRALEQQKREEQQILANAEGGAINQEGAKEARLKLNLQFAQELYATALQTFEQKQVEATQTAKFLSVIQSPRLADSAKYPNSLYNIATFFVLLSILYGVTVMIVAAVQEHRDV